MWKLKLLQDVGTARKGEEYTLILGQKVKYKRLDGSWKAIKMNKGGLVLDREDRKVLKIYEEDNKR